MTAVDVTDFRQQDAICLAEIVEARDAMQAELKALARSDTPVDVAGAMRFFRADRRFRDAIDKHDAVIGELTRALQKQD